MDLHTKHLHTAFQYASRSKDTSNKVGAVVVSTMHDVGGYNGIPRLVRDTVERMTIRPQKYKWMLHAECNAIVNCAREGVATNGASLYCTHHPCSICAGMIINAGIREVVISDKNLTPDFYSRWAEDVSIAMEMFTEAQVNLNIIEWNTNENGNNK